MKDDAPLRALLSRWDYDRSSQELLAMGPPALERILDASDGHGALDTPGADWRDYEDALHAAVAAFAAHDMNDVLARMRDRHWSDLDVALSGIARVPDPRIVSFLRSAYANKEPMTRQRVVTLLGMQRPPEATDALIAALSDRSPDVRMAAIDALGDVGDPRAVPALEATAKRSARSPDQTRRIDEVLEKLARRQPRAR